MSVSKIVVCLIFLLFTVTGVNAQTEAVEMADIMRDSGKIYVVVAVILLIFAGFVFFLIGIDRRVSKLEKGINKDS